MALAQRGQGPRARAQLKISSGLKGEALAEPSCSSWLRRCSDARLYSCAVELSPEYRQANYWGIACL